MEIIEKLALPAAARFLLVKQGLQSMATDGTDLTRNTDRASERYIKLT
ncbi:hypothetical protein [Serratia rhizosphaerae]|nr:hypothetical protein [Serratia rhizosphaerae]MEB6338414.1 hypothetical protein [Serratia rhizosphaerae]